VVDGEAALKQRLALKPRTGRAKNVILFIGDGMGLSTVVASRIFEGQSRRVDGPSNQLAFERLPHLALQKTYSTDTQVVDSAASASAMLTGVKTDNGVLGLTDAANRGECASARGNSIRTLAEMARLAGKATGAVTTTRLTHATPAALYAHTPHRDWEADADMPEAARQAGCVDIARQLVEAPAAVRLNVALGGGRARFVPSAPRAQAGAPASRDEAPRIGPGARRDDRDLTQAWVRAAPRSVYVSDARGLAALRPGGQDHVLGLFANDHLPYEADRARQGEGVPSLAEMTSKAIQLLSADRDGYFLMVEGGRIDHASHGNNAYRALTDTVAFDQAIRAALATVNLDETLVIVTADHSHGLVISGYADRNAPILGLAGDEGKPIVAGDGKPYTTLGYATGPGGAINKDLRNDPSDDDLHGPNYRQNATVPLPSAAHAGEDVPIYADGPQAHLINGVVEQSYLFYVMRHAMGLTPGRRR
jgi:alkaline phosphatase